MARDDVADQDARIFTEGDVYMIAGFLAGKWDVEDDTVPEDTEEAITEVLRAANSQPRSVE